MVDVRPLAILTW